MTTIRPLVNRLTAGILVLLCACAPEPESAASEAATLGAATYAVGETDATIEVSEGFVRPVAAGGLSTAGYMRLASAERLTITGARADGFGSVELHDVTMNGDLMQMRPIETIEVVPGRETALAPGAKHLMMMAPRQALEVGDLVTVTLLFEGGAETTVTLPVQRR